MHHDWTGTIAEHPLDKHGVENALGVWILDRGGGRSLFIPSTVLGRRRSNGLRILDVLRIGVADGDLVAHGDNYICVAPLQPENWANIVGVALIDGEPSRVIYEPEGLPQ